MGLSVGALSVACVLSPAEVHELIARIAGTGEVGQAEALRARSRSAVVERKERRGTGASEVVGLIRAGMLRVGEELVMRSGGGEHRARVLEDGRFEVGGRIERTPTEAASFVAQSRRSGWKIWTNAEGESLESLRWRARARAFRGGVESEVLMAWTEFALSRRLSPGRDHSGLLEAFCESAGVEADLAAGVLGEWREWCEYNKWTRSG